MKHYKPSLHRLAMKARERTNLLASPLNLYKEQEGLNDEQLATMLGCDIGAIARLALCERPRPVPHFRQDVERIATYIHADMLQLAMLIRAAEAREAFGSRPGGNAAALLAARDHDESEEVELPPENRPSDE